MLSLGDHAGQSVEKFKAKIQEITKRSHNLDEQLIVRLNQVIRGTANYFATPFSHNRKLFTVVDKWIRMRLRSMKFKRKWRTDNRRKTIFGFHSGRKPVMGDSQNIIA